METWEYAMRVGGAAAIGFTAGCSGKFEGNVQVEAEDGEEQSGEAMSTPEPTFTWPGKDESIFVPSPVSTLTAVPDESPSLAIPRDSLPGSGESIGWGTDDVTETVEGGVELPVEGSVVIEGSIDFDEDGVNARFAESIEATVGGTEVNFAVEVDIDAAMLSIPALLDGDIDYENRFDREALMAATEVLGVVCPGTAEQLAAERYGPELLPLRIFCDDFSRLEELYDGAAVEVTPADEVRESVLDEAYFSWGGKYADSFLVAPGYGNGDVIHDPRFPEASVPFDGGYTAETHRKALALQFLCGARVPSVGRVARDVAPIQAGWYGHQEAGTTRALNASLERDIRELGELESVTARKEECARDEEKYGLYDRMYIVPTTEDSTGAGQNTVMFTFLDELARAGMTAKEFATMQDTNGQQIWETIERNQ